MTAELASRVVEAPQTADGRATFGAAVLVTAVVYATGRFAASRALAETRSTSAFDPVGELVAAVLVAATLAILAARLGGAAGARARALAVVAFSSVAAVMVEGSAFAPAMSPVGVLPLGLLLQAAVASAAAGAAVIAMRRPVGPAPVTRPGSPRAIVRLLVAGALVYLLAYFVTGALDYALVTGPYYASDASGLATPPLPTVVAVALGEGVLLTAGALPAASGLVGSRRSRALACGLALWALGGVVPLVQASSLPDVVRLASVVEILFQKVPLGVAVVVLLDRVDRQGGPRS